MSDTPDTNGPDASAGPMQDTAVTITARAAAGFWRAGRHHPARPVTHPAGTFTDREMVVLLAEPQLVVTVAEPAAPTRRGRG